MKPGRDLFRFEIRYDGNFEHQNFQGTGNSSSRIDKEGPPPREHNDVKI